MRQGEGRRRQEPASYALASGGKGGREGEDRRCRFKREQAQKDGTDGKVARRMLQSMNLAKRECFEGGMGIAYLQLPCHSICGDEWHETNSVPLDEISENNPCKFFGQCYVLNSWTQ